MLVVTLASAAPPGPPAPPAPLGGSPFVPFTPVVPNMVTVVMGSFLYDSYILDIGVYGAMVRRHGGGGGTDSIAAKQPNP